MNTLWPKPNNLKINSKKTNAWHDIHTQAINRRYSKLAMTRKENKEIQRYHVAIPELLKWSLFSCFSSNSLFTICPSYLKTSNSHSLSISQKWSTHGQLAQIIHHFFNLKILLSRKWEKIIPKKKKKLNSHSFISHHS